MNIVRLFLILVAIYIANHNSSFAQNKQAGNGFAVVELFTSEGCSSCPAAEKVLSQLHNEYKNACFLEFHIDYWNYLGWKDTYSDHAYSERQQDYCKVLGLNSVYTPQAIVNGNREMVGSEATKLHTAIEACMKQAPLTGLEIKAVTSGNSVIVTYNTGVGDASLNIALVQLHASIDVKKGENSGRKLDHTNVVRSFKTIDIGKKSGNIAISLPDGLSKNDCHVIAYLQYKGTKEIVAAKEIQIGN